MQAIEWCHFRWPWVTPDPGFKVMVVLKGEYLQSDAFYKHSYYIGRNRTPWARYRFRQPSYSLQPHCSYINRANFSQASRGFVSDSWAFLFDLCWICIACTTDFEIAGMPIVKKSKIHSQRGWLLLKTRLLKPDNEATGNTAASTVGRLT